MEINCDISLAGLSPQITFEDGTIWLIPETEWEGMMDIILSPSIRRKYFQTDYHGQISETRYKSAKKYYKVICKKFRLNQSTN